MVVGRDFSKVFCPRCGQAMEMIGAVGVIHNDGDWETETERFDCPEGHTILVLETDGILGVEGMGHSAESKIYHQPMVLNEEISDE